MKVLLTGGTGWVGRRLIDRLKSPVITSRHAERARKQLGDRVSRVIPWDAVSGPIPPQHLEPADCIVNLMGDPIADGRWSDEKRKRISQSRTLGTSNLATSILESGMDLPKSFISASAIGIYGDTGETVIDETGNPGHDFLAEVCQDWEAAARPLLEAGVRVVWLRIGIVLGADGGALEKMLPPFRLGLGGRLGSGKQWMSWIHIDDLIHLILFAMQNDQLAGPVNAVAPHPVRNAEFTRELGKQLHRPALLPVPQFALRMALGAFANFLFYSQHVVPRAALRLGFQFQYPDLPSALRQTLNP